jgi:hypothetical protein
MAQELAPESGEIEALLGYLARAQDRLPEAVGHFREAVKKGPRDVAVIYALAQAIGDQGGAGADAEYQRLMGQILQIQPNNLKALVEKAKAAFRHKDMAAFRQAVARLGRLAPSWSERSREYLGKVAKAADKNRADVPSALAVLNNVLQAERDFKLGLEAVAPKADFIGRPVEQFLRLARPRSTPAPPDRDLTFAAAPWRPGGPLAGPGGGRWDVVRVVWRLTEQERQAVIEETSAAKSGGTRVRPAAAFEPMVFVANAREVRRADAEAAALTFPGGPGKVAPATAGVLPVDWDNDGRADLLLAGAGGLRFYHQRSGGTFEDVTDTTGLAADILTGDYYGAWAADLDSDGDLDIILGRRSGPPLVLRNNGDNTFTAVEGFFKGVSNVRAFVWADLDNDGMPDAAFLDAKGKLYVFANERAGLFDPWPVPGGIGALLAVTAADVNDDGMLDLVACKSDGTLVRLSAKEQRKSWEVVELARGPVPRDGAVGAVALFAGDLDNNGATDLVVAGPREAHVFLADERFRYGPLPAAVAGRVSAVLHLDPDGRLDFLTLSPEGRLARALNRGRKDYRWLVIRPLANPAAKGDQQNEYKLVNSFAVGGEAEVRSGALVQKRAMDGPLLHFGLGEQAGVDVARFVWPNGIPQWEFELAAGSIAAPGRAVRALQRLSGSCPFLFTYDGTGMRFVADFMWGTPLGMHVNGMDVGDFPETTEWLKVGGGQLVPRDGYYDVRVHANLWEADYFDRLALVVVDHPPGTEVYADERFPPPPPRPYLTTPARPVARAWDHRGEDVTDLVRSIDGRYLDRAGRGPYQGMTRDHWVEADLGDDAPAEGPVLLVARGWTHPTNSSINVALEQGRHDRPRGLVLEVPDGNGGWKVGRDKLGFPAGKNKTMLVRLDGIDGKRVSRRFRLRTNMEIYWDFLGYARELDPKGARLRRPAPLAAELRYRGILAMTQKDASSPEVPVYDKVIRGPQRWRDLTGYYTRFGDVRELLAGRDDRYVIMNAGDEIAFRFPVPAGPPPGWKRDFLWESDGWTRDGNPNTRFGTTVLPLPAHDRKIYHAPGSLEDDPVYRRCPQDWLTYHTRFVTAEEFARGLRTFRRPAGGE